VFSKAIVWVLADDVAALVAFLKPLTEDYDDA